MAAAFLPSILVPIVGLVFPALSMALFSFMFQSMILINPAFYSFLGFSNLRVL